MLRAGGQLWFFMELTFQDEVWRSIPPEEKFSYMAKAHASGVVASLYGLVLALTFALVFQSWMLVYLSCFLIPAVFQIVSFHRWRKLKPELILSYLAARSVARRFAFKNNAKDFTVLFMIRAEYHEPIDPSEGEVRREVCWIALFHSLVVVFKESKSGASLLAACHFTDQFNVEVDPVEQRQITFSYLETTLKSEERKITLYSPHPANLIACRDVSKKYAKEYIQKLELKKKLMGKI